MCIAAAIVGGAGLGAAGSVIAGNQQAKGQKQAVQTQADMFNTITGQQQPFVQGGYDSLSTLRQLLGLDAGTGAGGTAGTTGMATGSLLQPFNMTQDQLEQYPGYQFAKTQGESALRNSLTPTQGALSGSALKSLMNFNQGLATQTYQDAFNNYQTSQTNIFNRLNSLVGLGQNAAANVGNAGTQLGTGIAQAQAGAAASNAAGLVGATNSLGNSLSMLGMLKYLG